MADELVLPELPELPELLTIDIEDVTTGTLNGEGSFDKLMQTTKLHLQEEYSKGRIDSSDYAQVYLGTMNTVIDKAMNFALVVDKTAYELALLQLQYQIAILNRDKTLAEIAKIHSDILVNNKNMEMTDQQIAISKDQQLNIVEERANIIKTGAKILSDINVNDQQKLLLVEQTDNLKNDNGFKP